MRPVLLTFISLLACMGLAAALVSGVSSGTRDAAPAFTVPAVHAGEKASYVGGTSFSYHVLGEEAILTRNFSQARALAVAMNITGEPAVTAYVDLQTRLTEAVELHCQAQDVSGCIPFRVLRWDHQGAPGIAGASVLAGRAWQEGDAVTLAETCAACGMPYVLRIAAPDGASPPGTAFIAVFEGGPANPSVLAPSGRVHMGVDHAFPLRIQVGDNAWDLASYAPGSTPVAFGDAPAPSYAPLAQAVPYEAGIPVEGEPMGASWKDAREATHDDPLPSSDSTLLEVAYSTATASTRFPAVGLQVNESQMDEWSVLSTRSGEGTRVAYVREQPYPDVLAPLLPSPWVRSETPDAAAMAPFGCDPASVPLWDLVRLALGSGLIDRAAHFTYSRQSCEDALFDVSPGGSRIPNERVLLDAEDGLLRGFEFYETDP